MRRRRSGEQLEASFLLLRRIIPAILVRSSQLVAETTDPLPRRPEFSFKMRQVIKLMFAGRSRRFQPARECREACERLLHGMEVLFDVGGKVNATVRSKHSLKLGKHVRRHDAPLSMSAFPPG